MAFKLSLGYNNFKEEEGVEVIRPVFTMADLGQLPDDGKRYEIVQGDLVVSPSPNRKHQQVVWNLVEFFNRVKRAGFGTAYIAPFDVVFDNHNVTEPDMIFVRSDRLAIITDANVQGSPDLIVEVLSPSTRERDLGVKARLYARSGVLEYWVADPEVETLATHRLTDEGYRLAGPYRAGETVQSPLFPGIILAVSDLFRP